MAIVGGWIKRGALVTALVIAMFGFTGSANAAGWGAEFSLADGFSTNLATHMNQAGDATFIAADISLTGEAEVFSRTERSDGKPVARQPIFSAGMEDIVYALSEQDQDGTISVMWAELAGGGCACGDPSIVYITRLDANGKPLAQPLAVADYSADDLFFSSTSLSVADDGRVVVGVSVHDPASGDSWIEIFEISPDYRSATRITPNGFALGADDLDIANGASDRTLVTWRTGDELADTATIETQFVTASGPIGAPATLLSTSYDDQPFIDGTLLNDVGEGTVVFDREYFGSPGVEVVRISPAGTPLTTVTLDDALPVSGVALFTGGRGSNMAVLPGGEVLLAYWNEAGLDGLALRTFVIDGDGLVRSHEIALSSDEVEAMPTLAMRPDGSGGIVYLKVEEFDPGDDARVALDFRPLSVDGSPGPEETLAESLIGSSMPAFYVNPSLATTSPDQIAVSWTAFGLGPGSMLLSSHARIYDAVAPAISIKTPTVALAGSEVVLAAIVDDRNTTTTNWSFGDGQTAGGEIQTHAFQAPGTYEIKVEAKDAVGNVGAANRQIRVVAEAAPESRAAEAASESRSAPNTRITRPPRLRLRARRATVRFASTQADSTFRCRVGRGPLAGSRQARLRARGKGSKGLVVRGKWRKCSSPLRLRRLKPAVYVVRVRAVGHTGLRDRSPAVTRFRVLRPTKHMRAIIRARNRARR